MPKDDDVIAGELIEASWGNQVVRDKLVQRATNTADRTAGWPVPQNGETVWLQDEELLTIWDGEVWRVVALGPDQFLKLVGGTMTGTLEASAAGNAWIALDPAILTTDYFVDAPSAFGYYKDPGGGVTLTGRIANVDPGTIGEVTVGTLPVGLRPNTTSSYGLANSGVGECLRFVISTTGVMTFPSGGPGNSVYLDGVRFFAGWD